MSTTAVQVGVMLVLVLVFGLRSAHSDEASPPPSPKELVAKQFDALVGSLVPHLNAGRCEEAAKLANVTLRRAQRSLRKIGRQEPERPEFGGWADIIRELGAAWPTLDPPPDAADSDDRAGGEPCTGALAVAIPVLRLVSDELRLAQRRDAREVAMPHRSLALALRDSPAVCALPTPFGFGAILQLPGRRVAVWLPGSQSPSRAVEFFDHTPEGGQARVARFGNATRARLSGIRPPRTLSERTYTTTVVVGGDQPLGKVTAICRWVRRGDAVIQRSSIDSEPPPPPRSKT